jgi:hypothetical protein
MVLGAVVLTLLIGAAPAAAAAKPFIFHLDFEYQDDWTCGIPVWVHVTGQIIERFGQDELTLIESLKTEWTNLDTGKTVTTRLAGPFTYQADGAWLYQGMVLIQQPGGAWVDAGLTETVLDYDPETGEVTEVVIRSAGNGNFGGFNDALCAALQ